MAALRIPDAAPKMNLLYYRNVQTIKKALFMENKAFKHDIIQLQYSNLS